MMDRVKLSDLEATFVGQATADGSFMELGDRIDGAQGLFFVCPLCQKHHVLVWFGNPRNAPLAPANLKPKPRWKMSGTSLADVTLSPSVNLDVPQEDGTPPPCKWHGWVQNGNAA